MLPSNTISTFSTLPPLPPTLKTCASFESANVPQGPSGDVETATTSPDVRVREREPPCPTNPPWNVRAIDSIDATRFSPLSPPNVTLILCLLVATCCWSVVRPALYQARDGSEWSMLEGECSDLGGRVEEARTEREVRRGEGIGALFFFLWRHEEGGRVEGRRQASKRKGGRSVRLIRLIDDDLETWRIGIVL